MNLYTALGVAKTATEAEIKAAWKEAARRLHPDNPETGDEQAFKIAAEAYDVLSHSLRRKLYDDTGSVDKTLLRVSYGAQRPMEGFEGSAPPVEPDGLGADDPLLAEGREKIAMYFQQAIDNMDHWDGKSINLVISISKTLKQENAEISKVINDISRKIEKLSKHRPTLTGKIFQATIEKNLTKLKMQELQARRAQEVNLLAIAELKNYKHEPIIDPPPEEPFFPDGRGRVWVQY